jgi:hypothetical protein
MGGRALNKYGVHTERKNTDEFLTIGNELQDRIALDLPVSTAIVQCYRTKANHGDLDLLLKMDNGVEINWRTYIEKNFKPLAIHNNGGVFSFDYKNFQVDFIPIKESKWEIAQVYYSYDPLGNIMGKTFHKFGLSYGWDGLHYKYRNFRGTNSANILLSTDPRRIFDFGGYDYDRYLKGFDTIEEIFEFAIDSVNFDTEMFQMENLKSIDKKRNRKRGSYHLFLEYLKNNDVQIKTDFEEDKSMYLSPIDYFFPEVKLFEKLEELKDKDRVDSYVSQKFNGDIVMSWLPNLKGKELGAAMSKFKNYFASEANFRTFVIDCDYETIRRNFMRIYYGENQ